MILVDDVAGIDTSGVASTTVGLEPGLGDRFFVQVDSANPEIEVTDSTINATVELAGQVGSVKVAASGSGAANTANSSAAFQADVATFRAKLLHGSASHHFSSLENSKKPR